MSKNISFIAKDEYTWEVFPKPFPASSYIPKWWKNESPYQVTPNNPDGHRLIVEEHGTNASFKKCTPMLDALTSGYIIPLWTDVQVRQEKGSARVTWLVEDRDVFQPHLRSSSNIGSPPGYENSVLKYMNAWIPKTPSGYSCLIIPPVGYRDLAFRAIEAVVDTDKSNLELLTPVWVKKGFEGIVEKGTPMVQVIPFKRDDWKSEFSFYKNGEYDRMEDKGFNSTIIGHYLKNIWSKKTYK